MTRDVIISETRLVTYYQKLQLIEGNSESMRIFLRNLQNWSSESWLKGLNYSDVYSILNHLSSGTGYFPTAHAENTKEVPEEFGGRQIFLGNSTDPEIKDEKTILWSNQLGKNDPYIEKFLASFKEEEIEAFREKSSTISLLGR